MSVKRYVFAAFAVMASLLLMLAAGCGGNESVEGGQQEPKLSGILNLSGSTTVLPIAQEAAEMFMDENPGVTVNVQGGGSSVGISNVAEGVVDIGDSSRELKDEEKGLGLVDNKIALDVIVVIAHKDVPVDNLTAAQVKDIFTGKITNWKEVGGPDQPIKVVIRDEASGTREMFDEKALKKEKPVAGAIECNSNGIVRQTVSSTPFSIGYISLGYLDNSVKALKYDGVAANKENAVNNTYPLSRYLHMFTKGEATGLAKAFIDFVLSDRFQNEVVAREYIPMTQI
ncbi:phosphate ABC transporter substrate-binding protein [Candidatus Solincola tengchongensis]|uniref:phosphate ABC transporter substrate-binding protein n=1 Tax=Candidatus Solincola tengchongensis TaxID=2900693 RepID=UPI002580BF40|nr:phosphate ABC transporter substrate-binding protein [Candidatus Solincola tengchongensis]